MRNQNSLPATKLITGCAIIASLTTALSAFAQTIPSVDEQVQPLLEIVSEARERGVLRSFEIPASPASIKICQVKFSSDQDETLPAPRFYPRTTGSNQCSPADVSALTSEVPAQSCVFLAAQGLLDRAISISSLRAGTERAEVSQPSDNAFSGFVCNETDHGTPFSFTAFASGPFNWAAITRMTIPLSARNLERGAISTMSTYLNARIFNVSGTNRARNADGRQIEVTGAQLTGLSFENAPVCSVNIPHETDAQTNLVYSLLTASGRMSARTAGSNQCTDPSSAIAGPLAAHRCALFVASSLYGNETNNPSDIDLEVSLEGSTESFSDESSNNLPTVIVCNNSDAQKNIVLKGRQYNEGAHGESVITRVDFTPAVNVNFAAPPETPATSAQNLLNLLRSLSAQSVGARSIESEGNRSREERIDMINLINFSNVNFDTQPVCNVTMPARDPNSTTGAPILQARPRAGTPNGCTAADVTALNADISNGQCMAVFIRGNEQNLETRDIDAHVRFRGVGRTREAYVADSIMSADTNDNLPIIVKCNQSGSAMHPEIRGQQYKQLGTAAIEAAEAVMTRINFPAPAVAAPVPAVTPQRPPQSPNTRPASPRPNAAPAPAPAAPNGRSVFAP